MLTIQRFCPSSGPQLKTIEAMGAQMEVVTQASHFEINRQFHPFADNFSILFQLRSGHIGLNQHLFRFEFEDRKRHPALIVCGITGETVKHFLLDCPQYACERHELQTKLRQNSDCLSFLLSNPIATLPLLKFVHATDHFKAFSKDANDRIQINSRRKAELRSAAHRLEELLCNGNLRNTNRT
jgi:hypothetical protein